MAQRIEVEVSVSRVEQSHLWSTLNGTKIELVCVFEQHCWTSSFYLCWVLSIESGRTHRLIIRITSGRFPMKDADCVAANTDNQFPLLKSVSGLFTLPIGAEELKLHVCQGLCYFIFYPLDITNAVASVL